MRRLVTIACFFGALAVCAQVTGPWRIVDRSQHTTNPEHGFEFTVDSVDFRTDLTRVYGRFSGTPHVGVCVRQVIFTVPGKQNLMANDTDRFDLDKYFQFEEDPQFNAEMDFGPCTAADSFNLTFITAAGVISYIYRLDK